MSARLVFDLDGTLIDSAPDLHAGANGILQAEGHAPLTLEEARSYIGKGAEVFVARMRAARGIPESEHARLLKAFLDSYDSFVGLTRPYEGVADALKNLRASGHRLGVCTNKPLRPTRAVLAHVGLDGCFETVWGGDSLPVHKPDPAPLHAAFAALGEGPMIFVGDSEVDAETAARANVPFALFTEGYRKTPVEHMPASATFSAFSDLPALIERLLTGGQ